MEYVVGLSLFFDSRTEAPFEKQFTPNKQNTVCPVHTETMATAGADSDLSPPTVLHQGNCACCVRARV